MANLSIIILTRNVEDEVLLALKTARFAKEIVVVDTGSKDKTLEIARKHADKVVQFGGLDFAKWRNIGAKHASGEWLLYLDSDERIPKKLAAEIMRVLHDPGFDAYKIIRYEIILGKHLKHWPDSKVLRLMKKSSLKCWEGKVHEQPIIDGKIGTLEHKLVHLTHKNIDEKIKSTLSWSKIESQLLLDAKHPPVRGWRFIRIMLTEFYQRAIKQGLWLDGTEGWIEIIYQMFSRFITYERLWEAQRQPSLKTTYRTVDKKMLEEWKNKREL